MRMPRRAGTGEIGFNMTPMIDVVFLLIIFFLVSSHLARQETQLALDLPDATTGEIAKEDDTRRIVINILAGDDGKGGVRIGGQSVQGDALTKLIQFESDEHGGQIEVRLRCDKQVPYRLVAPVMLACAKANVWKVTFAVTEQRRRTGGSR